MKLRRLSPHVADSIWVFVKKGFVREEEEELVFATPERRDGDGTADAATPLAKASFDAHWWQAGRPPHLLKAFKVGSWYL